MVRMADLPTGIGSRNLRPAPLGRLINALALALLLSLLLLAATGRVGDAAAEPPCTRAAPLLICAPPIVRSGARLDLVLTVAPRGAFGTAVIELPPSLLEGAAIETLIPDAGVVGRADGGYDLQLRRLPAAQDTPVIIALQLRPGAYGVRAGDVVLRDGAREIARVRARWRVLP